MTDYRRSAQTSSVRNLQNLYSLVVGIALSYAVIQLTNAEQAPYVNTTALPLFFEFLVTPVPFYHGALRHLDATYIESGGKDLRAGALLVDFAILFVEGCIFVALAKFLTAPVAFAWGMVTILAVDVAWAMINLIFGAILVAIIVTLQHAVPADRLNTVNRPGFPESALVECRHQHRALNVPDLQSSFGRARADRQVPEPAEGCQQWIGWLWTEFGTILRQIQLVWEMHNATQTGRPADHLPQEQHGRSDSRGVRQWSHGADHSER